MIMVEYMSQESFNKLKQKLEAMKQKRAKISKTIGEARDHGDLRENSAYHAAKDEQGLNEMRIKDLETKLENVEVMDEKDIPKKDVVSLGSTVKIRAVDSGQEFTYMIVPEHEADILEDKISPESPVGGALLGQKAGKVIEVDVPAGLIKYKIIEIK